MRIFYFQINYLSNEQDLFYILEAELLLTTNELKQEKKKQAKKRSSANYWKRQSYQNAHESKQTNRELTNLKRRQKTAELSPKVSSKN